ncbi:hypothetical protein HRbin14_02078 [bacterium HR14]|nr:hypothetical protein HRbin14_02078 [bacterium HR14]
MGALESHKLRNPVSISLNLVTSLLVYGVSLEFDDNSATAFTFVVSR